MTGIVVVRGGALGDHVLTLPAVHRLRALFPREPLLWIGHRSRGRLAAPDRLVDVESPLGRALLAGETPSTGSREAQMALETLRRAKRVVAYSTTPEMTASALRRLCAGDVLAHDPRPPTGETVHTALHLLRAVDPDAALPSTCGPITPAAEEAAAAAAIWARSGVEPGRTVVLHAGSGGAAKCWPADRFAEIGASLVSAGWSVALLDGPVEQENADAYATLRRRFPAVSAEDPLVLAALLRDALALVGNDSGPGHLAAAVGTATLSLFGPTDPARWRPLGPAAQVVRSDRLGDLAVAPVRDAVLALLERAGQR